MTPEIVTTEQTKLDLPTGRPKSAYNSFRDTETYLKEKGKLAESDMEKAIKCWNARMNTKGRKIDNK